jgi:hypothetical protein
MDFHQGFADLCSLLNASQVEFFIVGGYAIAFHGAPRFTSDLDILIRPSRENTQCTLDAIAKFGFPVRGIAAQDFNLAT